jgi:surface protein
MVNHPVAATSLWLGPSAAADGVADDRMNAKNAVATTTETEEGQRQGTEAATASATLSSSSSSFAGAAEKADVAAAADHRGDMYDPLQAHDQTGIGTATVSPGYVPPEKLLVRAPLPDDNTRAHPPNDNTGKGRSSSVSSQTTTTMQPQRQPERGDEGEKMANSIFRNDSSTNNVVVQDESSIVDARRKEGGQGNGASNGTNVHDGLREESEAITAAAVVERDSSSPNDDTKSNNGESAITDTNNATDEGQKGTAQQGPTDFMDTENGRTVDVFSGDENNSVVLARSVVLAAGDMPDNSITNTDPDGNEQEHGAFSSEQEGGSAQQQSDEQKGEKSVDVEQPPERGGIDNANKTMEAVEEGRSAASPPDERPAGAPRRKRRIVVCLLCSVVGLVLIAGAVLGGLCGFGYCSTFLGGGEGAKRSTTVSGGTVSGGSGGPNGDSRGPGGDISKGDTNTSTGEEMLVQGIFITTSELRNAVKLYIDRRTAIPIEKWNVEVITDFSNLFDATLLRYDQINVDLGSWNMSNARTLAQMFRGQLQFEGTGLNSWDISKVTSLQGCFAQSSFQGDVSSWNTSNVEDFSYLFANSSFVGNVSGWNTSSARDMSFMFSGLQSFNSDISQWDTKNVEGRRKPITCDLFSST